MKTLRTLFATLSNLRWSSVLVLVLLAASVILCVLGHGDFGVMCILWAVLITQIQIANRR